MKMSSNIMILYLLLYLLKMVVLWTQTSMILSPVFNFPITPLSCMYLMKHKSDEIDKTNLLELSKN